MAKAQGKTVYLTYVDGIDTENVNNFITLINKVIAEEKPDALYFLISSPGGEVDAGVALYYFLKALPIKIIMHNIGSIDSIANVIFVAGEKRYAAPHTTFLFHGVTWFLSEQDLLLSQVTEMQDSMEKSHNTIEGIMCENTKLKKEVLRKLFAQGQTQELDFVLEHGIIHEIKFPKIPQNSLVISINSKS